MSQLMTQVTFLLFCAFQRQNLQAALWFSILLNLKHIYLYIAPAYFIYLLRSYCFGNKKSFYGIHWKRLAKLALIVITIFTLSFGPFVGQFVQVRQVFKFDCLYPSYVDLS